MSQPTEITHGGTRTLRTPTSTTAPRAPGQTFLHYAWSTDHKMIASSTCSPVWRWRSSAGFFAYVFRMQLAFPDKVVPFFGTVSPHQYNPLVTNHGTHHDLLGRDARADRGVRQLPDPADGRLRRHGVPAAQPPQLPDLPPLRDRADRVVLRAGRRLRRRVDRLPSARREPTTTSARSAAALGRRPSRSSSSPS